MALPNFFCPGTMRSGTTTLHFILSQHPDIYLPERKETRFFMWDSLYARGLKYYEDTYFSHWKNQKAVGEVGPDYMMFDTVPKRIRECLGDRVRFIFMLRQPAERAFSHYWFLHPRGVEERSFEEVMESPERECTASEWQIYTYCYVSRGYYVAQIHNFLDLFPRNQMFFVIFEDDFLLRRKETIGNILDFLGVKVLELNVDLRRNLPIKPRFNAINRFVRNTNPIRKIARHFVPSRYWRNRILYEIEHRNRVEFIPEKISPSYRKYLTEKFYAGEIRKLEDLLGRSLDIWRQ